MRKLSLLISMFIVFVLPGLAQKKENPGQELFTAILNGNSTIGGSINSPKEYQQAESLARDANARLLAGDIKAADLLIRKSIDIYPTKAVFDYAVTLAKMPDINGSNLIMDKLFGRVKSFEKQKIYYPENFTNKVVEIDVDLAKFRFAAEIAGVNKTYSDFKKIERSILLTVAQPMPDKKDNFDLISYHTKKLELAIYQKRYDDAFVINDQMLEQKLCNSHSHKVIKSSIYMEMGNYDQAILTLKGTKSIEILLFYIYAQKGNNEEAYSNYDKVKNIVGKSSREDYYLAMLDINKKDFQGALENLNNSITSRSTSGMSQYRQEPLWKVYNLIGDAYTGLRDYEKARDNYDISLLYYPEYQPAIDGLAKLEVKYATETATDKTPPLISLLEPSPQRGLKVSTAIAKVMIKGIANDPSGIKEVFINGQKVYSQSGGDFWSDVALTDGLNKISIAATDLAGNKAEQIFEIEKVQPVENAVQTDIVAITEKEGKNYCLLIAAQNYSDSSIPSLEDPIADAVKLKIILKSLYNFSDGNIISLFNPGTDDIKRQLLELTNVIQPEDNLLIFYAGHGIWKKEENKGYWLLTDAKYNDVNTWLPNKDVLTLIAKLPSRHTLLITDACFSGSLFKTRGLGTNVPAAIKEMDNKISRVAITSGNDTEVPDKSVFMKYLVKALSENKEQYLTAQKMFINQILEAVMTETKTEPRYGTLELAGHVGGDYIFSRK